MDIRDKASRHGGNICLPKKTKVNRSNKTATFSLNDYPEEGVETELELPILFEVCSVCEGSGTHLNPSVDADGLTVDDFREDPDFEEEYWNGRYDVNCYNCHGQTTEAVLDRENIDPEILRRLDQSQECERQYDAEAEAERRFGC